MDVPAEFTTRRREAGGTRPIVARPKLDAAEAERLLGQVSAVEWSALHHAYGRASDVPGQLAAVIVGDDGTRDDAWWDLWGNIQALLMLREIAAAPGGELHAAPLLADWRSEPPDVQRALLWLLCVDPGLRAERQDLVDAVLPERHRAAWDLEIAGTADSEEEEDAVIALEDWVHSGA